MPGQIRLPSGDESDSENECQCMNVEIINVHPRVILAFTVTLLVLVTCVVLLIIHPEWKDGLLPVMTTLGGLWVPSPAQMTNRRRVATRIR